MNDPTQPRPQCFLFPILCAVLIGSFGALSGCNYIGPMGYLIGGNGTVKAAYQLDKTRSHVVFVDDRENLLSNRPLRRTIAQCAERTLLDDNAVEKSDIISSEAVEAVTAADKWGRPMGISQVGQAVNADVVIYATIDQFTISSDGVSLSPQAVLRVKVVDAKTRERLFPTTENDWHTVQTVVPRRDGMTPKTASEVALEERRLAERVGRDLAYVFIDHEFVPMENRIHGYE